MRPNFRMYKWTPWKWTPRPTTGTKKSSSSTCAIRKFQRGLLSSSLLFGNAPYFTSTSLHRCCVVDVLCCVRRSFFLAMVVAVVMASVTVVKVRDGLFKETTPSDYYLRDSSAYVAFLLWGDAGTGDLLLNFSSTGQRSAYGTQLSSTEGWENICPLDQMELFVSGEADERCSYLNPGGYVQGCTAGFYQPNADVERAPLPCPDGFMCPGNFLCTVACVPGSQCFNSTLVLDSGTCNYPNTMEGGRPADPLAITTTFSASNEASQSSTELVCPGSGNMYLCRGGFFCETALTSQPCPEVRKQCFQFASRGNLSVDSYFPLCRRGITAQSAV